MATNPQAGRRMISTKTDKPRDTNMYLEDFGIMYLIINGI